MAYFFEIVPAAQKYCQNRELSVLWKSSKNQLGWPEILPFEKILDPPLYILCY